MEARREIVRIFADMLNGEGLEDRGDYSKFFDTTAFGFREIRIERPLRLNFQASPARLARLAEERAIQMLDEVGQRELIDALSDHLPTTLLTNRAEFRKTLNKALKDAGLKPGRAREEGDPVRLVRTRQGRGHLHRRQGQSRTDLRDHELVPLKEDLRDFVACEFTPLVTDAWVDESHTDACEGEVGRVGYEINFNRHFYKYVPPRLLEKIDDELKQLEAEIAGLLKEVAA